MIYPLVKSVSGKKFIFAGKDAKDFFHRMATNNFETLQAGRLVPGAILNGKAGIISVFWVGEIDNHLVFYVADTFAIDFKNHVEAMNFGEDLGLSESSVVWLEVFGDLNGINLETHLLIDQIGTNACLLEVPDLEATISLGLPSPNQCTNYEIANIIPPFDESFLAGTMILDTALDSAIDRNKGCYPGQEVVEKVYSYGRRPKALVRMEPSDQVEPDELDDLMVDGKKIGRLVKFYALPNGKYGGLALVQRGKVGIGLATELKSTKIELKIRDSVE